MFTMWTFNLSIAMSVKDQFKYNLWATSSSYEEVLPYVDDDRYLVTNTYHSNGLFDKYYVGLK